MKCDDDIKDLDNIKKLVFAITGLSAVVQRGIDKQDLDAEWCLQHCCHSNKCKDTQGYMCDDDNIKSTFSPSP